MNHHFLGGQKDFFGIETTPKTPAENQILHQNYQ
jgi:hypothetical protein